MKRKKVFKSLILVAIVLVLTACNKTTQQQAEKKITIATAGDIKPFSYEENGQLTGYDIEVIKAAFKNLSEYNIEFKTTSWESIFIGLDSGKFQAAANNLSYTEERANKYIYSYPIATNPLVLVVNKNSEIKSLNDISGKTTQDDTGTSTAQLVTNWNDQHTDNPSIINYTGEDVAKRLLDLSNNEFDYLIFDKISVETIIKQNAYDLKVIELDLEDNPNNYIIFSDDSDELAATFNDEIVKLYKNGTLEKLSQKYLGGTYLPNMSQLK
jgi:polar amino acid transport system substrate-binding protein